MRNYKIKLSSKPEQHLVMVETLIYMWVNFCCCAIAPDIRNLTAFQQNSAITAQIPQSTEVIVQATSWHRNAQGKIELVASQSSIEKQQALTCAAIPLS